VARHIFHVSATTAVVSNVGGDPASQLPLLAFSLVIASAATIGWSALDRKRLEYARLYAWLRLVLRLLLALTLFEYGMVKVVPAQFGYMTPDRLALPFGALTPKQILWAFMASSPGYTMFTGWIEVAAGALLLIPRLATLGALLAATALTNIVALNLFYDVPVKIFSFHLLLFAILVALPDIPRLADVLLLNRTALPSSPVRLFRDKRSETRFRWASFGLAALWVASIAYGIFRYFTR